MPVITLELAKEIAISAKEQKARLVKEITDTVSKVTNQPKEAIYVLIKVNEPENVGCWQTSI